MDWVRCIEGDDEIAWTEWYDWSEPSDLDELRQMTNTHETKHMEDWMGSVEWDAWNGWIELEDWAMQSLGSAHRQSLISIVEVGQVSDPCAVPWNLIPVQQEATKQQEHHDG